MIAMVVPLVEISTDRYQTDPCKTLRVFKQRKYILKWEIGVRDGGADDCFVRK